ncbi:MAG TPA: AraC family transcriptional regulator [Bacilli bacterium]|nr:AraC family transcriptional regulator [Bacilli bacterium]
MDQNKRFIFSVSDKMLPLYIESIGFNANELNFNRQEGYPYYHWLQTFKGQGFFKFGGEKFILNPGKSVLLMPHTPHSYYSDPTHEEEWSTFYITFSGKAIDAILNSLDMNYSAIYEKVENISIIKIIKEMINKIESDDQYLDFELSADLYYFLMMFKKHGKIDRKLATSQSYEKIRPIVEWLELMYPENIGLLEMSKKAKMSPQHLNTLFQETFGMSPYSFLVQLRIREAKTLLITDRSLTLKELSRLVGFNGESHFVSTFKKREGVTPSTYRHMNS